MLLNRRATVGPFGGVARAVPQYVFPDSRYRPVADGLRPGKPNPFPTANGTDSPCRTQQRWHTLKIRSEAEQLSSSEPSLCDLPFFAKQSLFQLSLQTTWPVALPFGGRDLPGFHQHLEATQTLAHLVLRVQTDTRWCGRMN